MHTLEGHLDSLRNCCTTLPDKRRGSNTQYAMTDIAMAAFAVFFTQSASFLKFQRALQRNHARSNAHTLFELKRIPSDNHLRNLLDGVPPQHFDKVFLNMLVDTHAQGRLTHMQRLGKRTLIAIDGTEYFSSERIHCPQCSSRKSNKDG